MLPKAVLFKVAPVFVHLNVNPLGNNKAVQQVKLNWKKCNSNGNVNEYRSTLHNRLPLQDNPPPSRCLE